MGNSRRQRGNKRHPDVQSPLRPANQAEVMIVRHEQRTQEFSGPVPNPEILARYNELVPGSAERILQMAEREQHRRHDTEQSHIDLNRHFLNSSIAQSKWGLVASITFAFTCLGAASWLIMLGHEVGGGIIFGASMVAIVLGLLRHTRTPKE